jgi:hypothetical protein
VATRALSLLFEMPRPCAVEFHAGGYKSALSTLRDATALCRGVSRLWLQERPLYSNRVGRELVIATNVRLHGARPWHLEERGRFLATNVRLHGARPWHLEEREGAFLSHKRETPRRKAVASRRERARAFCSCEREAPRRKAVASVCLRMIQIKTGAPKRIKARREVNKNKRPRSESSRPLA